MQHRVFSFWLLLALSALPAFAQPFRSRELVRAHPWVSNSELRLQHGDDPAWARPEHDDRDWTRSDELPARKGIYWVRTRINITEPSQPLDALAIAAVASYEAYWDGRLVGRSGTVGRDAASEVPGGLDQVFPLPAESVAPGSHVLALRISSFHTGYRTPTYAILLGLTSQREYFTARSRAATYSIVIVGGFLVLGLFNVLFGLLVRCRAPQLLFGLMCLSGAAMQVLQSSRLLFPYSYDWHYLRIVALFFSVAGFGCLLVAFVSAFFRLRGALWYVTSIVVAAFALRAAKIPAATTTIASVGMIALLIVTGLGIAAVVQGRRWSWLIVVGLVVSLIQVGRSFAGLPDQLLIQGYGAAVLACFIVLTLHLRADRRAAIQAQMTAARLEIELLKKNIQPHFLLNTLTTLTEVIEQEPRVAVGLIEALAAEFRLLARMSGERLVPMRQELQLCREHLRVMSLRQDMHYSLRVENVDDDQLVPPALFLTLVENGVTHTRARGGAVEFVMRREVDGDTDRHVFFTPLVAERGRRPAVPAADRAAVVEGTGSRYVKARLEESFPGRWKFTSGAVAGGWETLVEFHRESVEQSPA